MDNQQFSSSYEKKNGLAIAGFVCSCVSFFLPGMILPILGFIFGIVGRNGSTDKTYRGLGTAAFVIAIVFFVFRLIAIIASLIMMSLGLFAPIIAYFAAIMSQY
ncbi:MAG: hypothetical protein K5654_06875 [Lachnospiraceae bacterium]|nr:hypothetical protein [Lachnospiraceae bacterium]